MENALQAPLVFSIANETLQLETQRPDFFRRGQLTDFCHAVVEQRRFRRVLLKVNRSRQNLSNLNALGLQEIKKRLNRCQSSRVSLSGRSILIHEHDGDGGLWVVNVEGATNGGQPDKAGASVVVADIERNRQAVATGPAAENGKPGHGQNIP